MKITNEELYKELEKRIKKGIGTKCKDFNISCFTCQSYMALEIIELNFSLGEEK